MSKPSFAYGSCHWLARVAVDRAFYSGRMLNRTISVQSRRPSHPNRQTSLQNSPVAALRSSRKTSERREVPRKVRLKASEPVVNSPVPIEQIKKYLSNENIGVIVLKGGRARLFRQEENSLVYAGAIEATIPRLNETSLFPGDPVAVVDGAGLPVALGFYNPWSAYATVRIIVHCAATLNAQKSDAKSEYSAREMSDVQEVISGSSYWNLPHFDVEFELRKRVKTAFKIRQSLGLPSTANTVFRAINGEGDRLSGIAVDVYGPVAVILSGALWAERFRNVIEHIILDCLRTEWHDSPEVARVIWRQSTDRLRQDGLDKVTPAELQLFTHSPDINGAHGLCMNENPTENVTDSISSSAEELCIVENGIQYVLPTFWLETGQKSGFYADQAENRILIRRLLERRREGGSVLDCYCYCGGFSLSAALGGASQVVAVDSSATCIEVGKRNAVLNGVGHVISWVQADVSKYLHSLALEGALFDLIILDPPKFAPSKSVLDRAAIKYMKVNAAALKLLRRDGLLFTCTCSAAMTRDSGRFVSTVKKAAALAGRELTLLSVSGASLDHPVDIAEVPDAGYLTACLFSVH